MEYITWIGKQYFNHSHVLEIAQGFVSSKPSMAVV